MRVLKVVQAYHPFQERGGPVVKVSALVCGLSQRGHRVTVLTADLGIGKMTLGERAFKPCAWGWKTERDAAEVIYLRTWARYRSLTLNPAVVGFCRGSIHSFDLVHIYGLYDLLGCVVGHFCSRRRIPYILEPMGMLLPIVRNVRLKRLYHRLFGQRLVRDARRVIATSDQEREEFLRGGVRLEQIVIRRNGVDLPEQFPEPGKFRGQWRIPPDAPLVLFLGRLVPKKDPELLIEAFAGWRGNAAGADKAVLVLAGPEEDGDYAEKLKSRTKQLNLQKCVRFTGPLYDDAKWAAYCDADVFVLPSQNENFGNTAAEALAAGTPVILSDRCGIAKLFDQKAALVVPRERQAVATALKRFFENPLLRQRLREGCAQMRHELTWEEPLAETEMLYQQVCGEGLRP